MYAMVQLRNDVPGGVYFFVSIEAKGKAPVLRESSFKTKVELRWTAALSQYPQTSCAEFVVNDNALHAVVAIANDAAEPEKRLEELLQHFQAQASLDWKGGGPLWNPTPKVRRITKQDELDSLRDFIVQKMLGGKELSQLEELDEDDENDRYDN
jgi:hypothetical protein